MNGHSANIRKLKIGVIIDGTKLARWQAQALLAVAENAEFVIYSCTAKAPARRRSSHALYYLLNLFTVRNRFTRKVGLPAALDVVASRTFAPPYEGAWQSLPEDLLQNIKRD